MELKEFFENFLSNDYNKNIILDKFSDYEDADKEFCPYAFIDCIIAAFPEALQNFADMICKKQRINCSDFGYKEYNPIEFPDDFDFDYITNAEQPKLEEL